MDNNSKIDLPASSKLALLFSWGLIGVICVIGVYFFLVVARLSTDPGYWGSGRRQHRFFTAIQNKDTATVKKLLDFKPRFYRNTADEAGTTGLMLAVKSDCVECEKLLLEAGADVTRRDKAGNTALAYARREGNVISVHMLQKPGIFASHASVPLRSGFPYERWYDLVCEAVVRHQLVNFPDQSHFYVTVEGHAPTGSQAQRLANIGASIMRSEVVVKPLSLAQAQGRDRSWVWLRILHVPRFPPLLYPIVRAETVFRRKRMVTEYTLTPGKTNYEVIYGKIVRRSYREIL